MSRNFLRGPDLFRGRKQVFDDCIAPNQSADMKYLPHLLLACATALSFASCAAPGGAGGGGASTETQLGPHSAQKFALVTRRSGAQNPDPQASRTVALVIKVEQQMTSGGQEIKATASAHRDGPNGALTTGVILSAEVVQPEEFKTEPRETGEARVNKTIGAQGNKFRTVVARAVASSKEFPDAVVELTIPGDQ